MRTAYRPPTRTLRPTRLLRARSQIALFLWLPLVACGSSKPSQKDVAEALKVSSQFTPPKTALVWKELYVRTGEDAGGGALNNKLLSKVDGVLPILRANELVAIEDQAVSSGDGGYMHMMRITPTDAGVATKAFLETDEQPPPDPYSHERRVAGWKVALAHRELVRVIDILTAGDPLADKLSPGYVQANFEFKWVPTEVGALFDQASTSFDDLSEEDQRAAKWAGKLDSRQTYGARAWLHKDKELKWVVTGINCPRC